jgi:hypothetical protein
MSGFRMLRSFWPFMTRLGSLSVTAMLLGGVLYAQSTERVFQGAMTSSGRNRPAISLAKDDLIKLSGLLHQRIPRSELLTRLRVSEDELQRRLGLLLGEGLAKTAPENRVLPTPTPARNA